MTGIILEPLDYGQPKPTAYCWKTRETLAVYREILRRPDSLPLWLGVETDAELAAALRARLHSGAKALTAGSPYHLLLTLALRRVDFDQLSEQLHLERSRREVWL